MPKPKFWGNFQNRAGIPLLFTALDGVGDHRALYHIPNNINIYLANVGVLSHVQVQKMVGKFKLSSMRLLRDYCRMDWNSLTFFSKSIP